MNPFDISNCINIAKSYLFFEQYIMALNQDKYDIEVRDDDAIKRDRIFFISCNERSIVWMDYIRIKHLFDRYNQKYQLRKQSAEEVERFNREKK